MALILIQTVCKAYRQTTQTRLVLIGVCIQHRICVGLMYGQCFNSKIMGSLESKLFVLTLRTLARIWRCQGDMRYSLGYIVLYYIIVVVS